MHASSRNMLFARVGFWSALLIILLFVVFTICFVGIALTSPLFRWTGNLSDYFAFVNDNNQFFQNLARLSMLLFGPLFIILLNSIHEFVQHSKKYLTRVSIHLAVIFAALSGINYFVQLTAIRFQIAEGESAGLQYFLQANPHSIISAINILGFSLFLGLASLFVAAAFEHNRLERIIAIAFAVNGIACLLGGLGYALENDVLVFITLNFGLGGAIVIAAVGLCILFRRVKPAEIQAQAM
ncbi:MAG: hypothetical protein K8L99_36355 [Anaerolineae bacterium]|nr:hypothetical protein [Anaerolineae bacterium]